MTVTNTFPALIAAMELKKSAFARRSAAVEITIIMQKKMDQINMYIWAQETARMLSVSVRLAFQAEYPENYPEFKTETTSDGVKVKSVSEALLYERFKSAGFFQIYELPLVLKDHGPAIYPDFTILSPVDMKTQIYVEYVGRLNLPKYREDFARRLHRYISNGYKPGVNVFFIFSDSNGHIDSMQINRVIAEIRGI